MLVILSTARDHCNVSDDSVTILASKRYFAQLSMANSLGSSTLNTHCLVHKKQFLKTIQGSFACAKLPHQNRHKDRLTKAPVRI
jgi:hypothetical protein